ncbi:MAG: protoglobin domain-containing protein, partial [Nitrososphaerota archaeon]
MNEIDLRKQFLRLEQADQEALKELRSLFTDHADEIVDAFYEHLFQFEPTRKFLSQENVNQKLKAVQKQYLLSLTSGHYEQEYFDSRKRIGSAHEKVKLAPEYY